MQSSMAASFAPRTALIPSTGRQSLSEHSRRQSKIQGKLLLSLLAAMAAAAARSRPSAQPRLPDRSLESAGLRWAGLVAGATQGKRDGLGIAPPACT